MDIEFNLTLDDIIASNLYQAHRLPEYQDALAFTRPRVTFILALMFFLYFLVLILIWGKHLLLPSIFVAVIAGVVTGVIVYLIYPQQYKKMTDKRLSKSFSEGRYGSHIGIHKIMITPEAIISESPIGEGKTFWKSVDKIEQTSEFIFIHIGSIGAYFIPRRDLSDEQRGSFLELAKQYYKDSTGQTLPITSA
jgi:hypothetical protein